MVACNCNDTFTGDPFRCLLSRISVFMSTLFAVALAVSSTMPADRSPVKMTLGDTSREPASGLQVRLPPFAN